MIKRIKKISIIIISIVVCCYVLLFGFVLLRGKSIASTLIERFTGRKASVGSVVLLPPFSLVINDASMENLLYIKRAVIQPSIIGFLIRKPGLSKIFLRKPRLEVTRINKDEFNFTSIVDFIRSRKERKALDGKKNFFVKDIAIDNGEIVCNDEFANMSFSVFPVNVSISTSILNFRTNFSLRSNIVVGDNEKIGDIDISGWLNWPKKDLDGKVVFGDIEIAHFNPYLKNVIGKKVYSGNLLFTSDMFAKDNDLKVDCHVELNGISFGDKPMLFDFENKEVAILSVPLVIAVNSIIGSGNSGVFDFSIQTKLDKPKFEGIKFKGNIFPNIIINSLKKTPEIPVETIKGIKKDFKQIGKELKGQFEEIVEDLKSKVKVTEEEIIDKEAVVDDTEQEKAQEEASLESQEEAVVLEQPKEEQESGLKAAAEEILEEVINITDEGMIEIPSAL